MTMRGRKPNVPIKVRVNGVRIEDGKRCSKCSTVKPLEKFDRLWRSSDGRTNICKRCKREENAKRSRAKY